MLDVSSTDLQDWADLFTTGDGDYMEQVGDDVVIHTTENDTVTLQGIHINSLTDADFIF